MGRVGAGSPYCTHTRTGANGKVTGRGAPTRPNVTGWQWPKGAGVSPQLCGLGQSRVAAIASWTLADGSVAAVHPVLVFALQTTQHVDALKVIHALSGGLPQDHLVVLVHVTQVGRCRCHVRSFHHAAGLGDLLERGVARQGYPLMSRDPSQGGCPRYDEQSLRTGPHLNSAHLQIDVLREPTGLTWMPLGKGGPGKRLTIRPLDRPHLESSLNALKKSSALARWDEASARAWRGGIIEVSGLRSLDRCHIFPRDAANFRGKSPQPHGGV